MMVEKLIYSSALLILFLAVVAGQYPDMVLLKDIQVLTLRQGHMTTGRRSSPVPQLKCVGGTAGCHAFVPQIIQCYNRGSDGVDVQWECKTDMDNEFRFGRTDVTCEGYNYPDDPYVLKGSCGVEYTLDLTKAGQQNQHRHQDQQHGGYTYGKPYKEDSNWGSGVALIVAVIIVYIVYKQCLATPTHPDGHTPHRDDSTDFRGPPPPYTPRSDGNNSGGQAPPPPGFKPEYTQGATAGTTYTGAAGSTYGTGATYRGSSTGFAHDQYSGTRTEAPPQAANNQDGPGFWSGAAAGGLLGYLFGSSSNRGYGGVNNGGYEGYSPYSSTNRRGDWGSHSTGGGWFSNSGSSGSTNYFSSGGSTGSSSSSGTRTASGYGGTSRR